MAASQHLHIPAKCTHYRHIIIQRANGHVVCGDSEGGGQRGAACPGRPLAGTSCGRSPPRTPGLDNRSGSALEALADTEIMCLALRGEGQTLVKDHSLALLPLPSRGPVQSICRQLNQSQALSSFLKPQSVPLFWQECSTRWLQDLSALVSHHRAGRESCAHKSLLGPSASQRCAVSSSFGRKLPGNLTN
ncbi:hypothetical protein AAFF_G00209620 [Aldrovandia affinis]|uniref:Uncharacterized protein n=1 Tax=Aldrovandia affinis TaxID=143900 RepID=A0AAD7SWB7_9TELE|nr:hypothetical protein AAFF_G00209620 [Aldrovandia affinis]